MTRRRTPRPARRVTVRGVRRDPPDIHRLSRAVIQIALEQAQAEADAAAQDTTHHDKTGPEAEEPDEKEAEGGR